MRSYPQHLVLAAKNLLDNPDVSAILEQRKQELQEDVFHSVEEKMILEAHTELKNLLAFGEWIEHVAGHRINEQAD